MTITDQVGTAERPLRVAVVGAGPAGFYAAEALLKREGLVAQVDLFERLPAPHGLVRYGVAPDHQRIKKVSDVYDRIAGLDGVRLIANVTVGRDVLHGTLLKHYHQVLYTVGCEVSRMLGIPGEELGGVYGATAFVAWYNGHPDFTDLDVRLDAERAVVVGIGDVAMDITRLLVQDVDELARTDIADYALQHFRTSQVREVVMLARRSPAEAAFALKELKDIAELPGVDVRPDPGPVRDAVARAVQLDAASRKKVQYLADLVERPERPDAKRVVLRFLVSPTEVLGAEARVTGVEVEHNELVRGRGDRMLARGTGDTETLDAGLVLRSIGYRGIPVEGVPFDHHSGRIPNVDGRVTLDDWERQIMPRTYAAGWIKRGPVGLIGTNKGCAQDTVERMIEDCEASGSKWPELPDRTEIDRNLADRGIRIVGFDDWRRVDAHEREVGEARGKVREKLTSVDEVLAVLDGEPASS